MEVLDSLPVSWMSTHNTDRDWEFRTIKWRCTHCDKYCIPSKVVMETISLEVLAQEDSDLVYQLDAIMFQNEDGNDIAL